MRVKYIKKLCTVVLSALMVVSVMEMGNLPFSDTGLTVSAEEEGDYSYNILDDGTVEISKYNGSGGNITIPSVLGGKPVTKIGSMAFQENRKVLSVIIPESVTSIERQAFCFCYNLSSITIPNSVTYIDESAFDETEWFKNHKQKFLVVGNGILMDYNGNDSDITIPNTVTYIGGHSFFKNTTLNSVTIPDSVTNIGEFAFCRCTNLTSVTISDSVTSIGECAFGECSNLTSVKIPNSVTNVGERAFEECKNLTPITIPNGVTIIEKNTFYGCTNLKTITMYDSVTNIMEHALDGCDNLDVIIYYGTEEDFNNVVINDFYAPVTVYDPQTGEISEPSVKNPTKDKLKELVVYEEKPIYDKLTIMELYHTNTIAQK